MKSGISSKPYIWLVGAAVIIVAFVMYMWLDTRDLNRSHASEARPVLQTESTAQSSTEDVSAVIKTSPTRANIREETPVQRRRIDPEEQAEATRKFFRESSGSVATVSSEVRPRNVKTDDWMFAPGKNSRIGSESIDTRANSTIE